MNRPNISRCAQAFLKLGWSFYPTRPQSKMPLGRLLPLKWNADGTPDRDERGRQKHTWAPLQRELPTQFDARMWFKEEPNANIALITGAVSRLVIMDLDTPDAVAAFCALLGVADIFDLGTPYVRSSRGTHVYFQHPGFDVRGEIGIPDCDVKADGGCCTAPPSIHQSGRVYRFELSPFRASLAPLPTPVLERLAAHEAARAAKRNAAMAACPMPSLSGVGASKYGLTALQNTLSELAQCSHERNKTLNAKAYAIGRIVGAGALDMETARAALTSAALEMGLTSSEIGPTIRSGLEDGINDPRIIQSRPMPATRPLPSLSQMRGAL